ncbi:MAG: methionyl-tRNA formyltransferase [Candidatus Omnitrophica bacterium]|nr:methionyl-tRNA formyltransferase [Candidatus Omnitrophota bacterium]
MKIVFFGSGEIAVHSLEVLLKNKTNILCVVTTPDKKRGRHLRISFTPIKELALKEKLKIFQPLNLRNKESLEYIKNLEPDIFVVFSYGKILPKELLNIPKIFPLNIHASLLPKYRGAAPINWALINGEQGTGITIIKMNEKMDEGDIILKREIAIDYIDNYITLEEKLSELGAQSLSETLMKIKNNEVKFTKQDNSKASYAPKLKKEDGQIDWNKHAEQIRDQIRGCLPWPGCFAFYEKNLVKIWRAEVIDVQKEREYLPGTIITFDKGGILVATKDKDLLIKELQLSSGKRLDAWQFIQGHKVEKNKLFE